MKIKIFALYKLIFTVGTILLFVSSALADKSKIDYPSQEGNSWTYSDIKNNGHSEVTWRIIGKEIIEGVETTKIERPKEYRFMAIDSEGLKEYKVEERKKAMYRIYNPPLLYLPNLEIGQSKEFLTTAIFYRANNKKIGELTVRGKVCLESKEDVEVPAGLFKGCLKFFWSDNVKNDITGYYRHRNSIIWLAYGVGVVKKLCFSIEYEPESKKEETSF